MDLFQLVGKIVIDNDKANRALDETTGKAEKSGGKMSKFFGAVGKGAATTAKVVGVGLGAAATAVGGITMKALSATGELEQNMGGSEAVFKKYASSMQETAKNAYGKMGLSTSDFLATANKMGSLFQGAGFDIKTSAELSSSAMQRAADVASIMGISTESAMESIAGAAKGNFTMMDNLGVAMNDTTLQAYALEKGINKSTREMTNQEKIGLAMEMFMERTAYAANNYTKENETLAGSFTTVKAALSNFLDGSGDAEALVNSFVGATNSIIKTLTDLAPRLVTGLTEIINKLVPMIPPLLQKLLPVVIEGAISLINAVVTALPQILDLLVSSAIPQLLSGLLTIFQALISALPGFVQSICSALPTLLPLLLEGVIGLIVALCSNFAQIIQPIIDILPELIVILVTTLLQNLPALLAGIGQLIMGIIRAIPQLLSALWQAITDLASKACSKLFNSVEGWIRKLFPKSADTILKILSTIKDYFSMLVKNIGAILSVVVSVISTPFKLAWNGIKLVWDNVVAFFKLIWNNIKAIFSVVDSVLAGDFKGAWDGIKKIWSNCVQFFKDIISNVKKAFSNVGEILAAPFRKGKEAIGKIVDNIKGFFKGVKIKFPNIPLPHFSVSPKGWKVADLLKGKLPKLGIDWYAKAMNNPMILEEPTVFGYNPATGKFQGGGEAGSEVVSGTNTLMGMIGQAVSANSAAQTEKIVSILTAILNAILGGNSELLQALLAGQVFKVNEREFARMVKEYA